MSGPTIRVRAMWLAALMPLVSAAQPAGGPERDVMRAHTVATEAFAIERAQDALEAADPRRAMIATVAFAHGRGTWMASVMKDDPEARARQDALRRLALDAIALAQARAGDDPVVQLMLSLVCDQPWANCDADAAVARLATLEPDNGLAAVIALRRAHLVRDAAGAAAALEALAAAERYTSHEVDVLAAARAFAADGAPPADAPGWPIDATPDDRRAMVALSYWLVSPTTGLFPGGLADRCRATAKDSDERVRCARAARVLAGGDALVGRAIGLALLEDLAEDPNERARIRAERRDLDWQAAAYLELDPTPGQAPGSLTAFVDATIAAGGEMALRAKRLTEAGIPLTAPADWVPSDRKLRD